MNNVTQRISPKAVSPISSPKPIPFRVKGVDQSASTLLILKPIKRDSICSVSDDVYSMHSEPDDAPYASLVHEIVLINGEYTVAMASLVLALKNQLDTMASEPRLMSSVQSKLFPLLQNKFFTTQDVKIFCLEVFKLLLDLNFYPDLDFSNPSQDLLKLGFRPCDISKITYHWKESRTLNLIQKINNYFSEYRNNYYQNKSEFVALKKPIDQALAYIQNSKIQHYLNEHQLKDYSSVNYMGNLMKCILYLDKKLERVFANNQYPVNLLEFKEQINVLFVNAHKIDAVSNIRIATLYLFQVLAKRGILPRRPLVRLDDLISLGIPDVVVNRLKSDKELDILPLLRELIFLCAKHLNAEIIEDKYTSLDGCPDFPFVNHLRSQSPSDNFINQEIKCFKVSNQIKQNTQHPLTLLLEQKGGDEKWRKLQESRYTKIEKYISQNEYEKVIDPLERFSENSSHYDFKGIAKQKIDVIMDDLVDNCDFIDATKIIETIHLFKDLYGYEELTSAEAKIIVLKVFRLLSNYTESLKINMEHSLTEKLKSLGFNDLFISKLDIHYFNPMYSFKNYIQCGFDLLNDLKNEIQFEGFHVKNDIDSKFIPEIEAIKQLMSAYKDNKNIEMRMSKYHFGKVMQVSRRIKRLKPQDFKSGDGISAKISSLFGNLDFDSKESNYLGIYLVHKLLELKVFPRTLGFKYPFFRSLGIPEKVYKHLEHGSSGEILQKTAALYNAINSADPNLVLSRSPKIALKKSSPGSLSLLAASLKFSAFAGEPLSESEMSPVVIFEEYARPLSDEISSTKMAEILSESKEEEMDS